MKKLLSLATVVFISLTVVAQLKSPEQFLGYKVGTRYTRHHDVLEYFKHVAKEVPQIIKLQQYGKTTEGRPLYLAFISNAGNISNLENIRLNNLRLAKQSGDNATANASNPAIVWLSYNVHGNETSSTEASMLTLFSLADPSDTQTRNGCKTQLW